MRKDAMSLRIGLELLGLILLRGRGLNLELESKNTGATWNKLIPKKYAHHEE